MKLLPSMPVWTSGFKLVTSVCDGCQRSLTTRHQSAHNVGIKMYDAWYCGAQCFTAAAERVVSQLLASGSEPVKRAERMPLGLLLVSRGLLTKEQLKDVTHEQKESGVEMGALLISRGMVSEKQVATARATQWGCPLFTVPSQGAPGGMRLPPALVESYSAVPLHYGRAANQLLVGFVHGIEYGLLYAIEHIMSCKTQASFVTPSDFQIQLKVHGETAVGDPWMCESVLHPAAMARALCKAALDIEAHEAVIAKCKGYLWARLKRENEVTDLLLKTR